MEKVVSSTTATPGQVHEMYLQIEKVLKGTKNPYETMSKLLKGKVLERAAREYVKQNDSGVSEEFDATEYVVTTTPSGNTYNIKNDIKKLLPTKAEGGLFDYGDNDIVDLFGDVNFTGDVNFADSEAVTGKVQLFKNAIIHRNIIAEGENLGIYQEYELGSALLLANELVKAGAIEKSGCGVIIYLKNRKNDIRYRLIVWRNDRGELGVDVYNLDLDSKWRAGYGVLFSI